MGRFELTDAQREAIAVFILAQVEKSPSGGKGDTPHLPARPSRCFAPMETVPFSASKYVYHPDPRRKAAIEGRKVIDKYACTECHTLELERWTLGKGVRNFGEDPEGLRKRSDPFSGMPRLDRQGGAAGR